MRYRYALLILLLFAAASYAGSKNSFPHGSKKHRTVDCAKCHSTVSVAKPDVTRFPGHKACSSCHDFSKEALEHTEQFCGICHSGTPESAQKPALFRFPKGSVPTDFGYAFPHLGHLKTLPATANVMQPFAAGESPVCSNCHHAAPARADYMTDWGHQPCFACHGEQPVAKPAYNECKTCHVAEGERFVSLIDSVKKFSHQEHSIDIRSKKKADLAKYKKPDFLCMDCHSNVLTSAKLSEIQLPKGEYCNTCHNGKIGLPDPLPIETLAVLNTGK